MHEHQQSVSEHYKSPELPSEMGFQAYELFGGDGEYREQQKVAFLAGEIRNPVLDYPLLDERKLAGHLHNMESVFDVSTQYDHPELGGVLWDSASYRTAEMYFLLQAKRMNALSDKPDSNEFGVEATRYQQLNEELYGRPTPETHAKVLGEVLAQAGGHALGKNAQKIYDEFVQREGIDDVTKYAERLPQGLPEKLANLREVLYEQFADVIRIVNNYWNDTVLARGDETPAYSVEDMKRVFELVNEHYDSNGESGITVVIDPNASALSWDTPTRSIRIGGKRASITSPTEMAAKVVHEYGVHAVRTINGDKYEIPGFGTGMYSDADVEERSDYLTFEEGFASLCEMAMDNSFSKWKPVHISHYMALGEAYKGRDFRDAYEQTWRARALMSIDSKGNISDKAIETAQKQAYVSCVRVFRGTPTQLENGPILTFNKDLAYLNGKLDALKYLEQVAGDKAAIARLFSGKFDPNNHLQNNIVKRHVD